MLIRCNWQTGWQTVYHALRICYATKEHETEEEKKKYVKGHAIVKGHDAPLEHCVISLKVENFERLLLHQFAKHRVGTSFTTESSRYTLKKLLSEVDIMKLPVEKMQKYFKFPQHITPWERECLCDYYNGAIALIQMFINADRTEQAKYAVPEGYLTQFYWTVNARALRNFLKLRLDKHASPAMEQFADLILDELPYDIYWLFEDLAEGANRRDINKRWK